MSIDVSFPVSPWLLGFAAIGLALLVSSVRARFARSEAEMRADKLIARIARRSAGGTRVSPPQ